MKNLLIVSPTPTHPTLGGSSSCILSYCQLFLKLDYNVFFLWVKNSQVDDAIETQMQNYWKDNLIVYRKSFFHRLLEALHRRLFFKLGGSFRLDSFYPWGIGSLLRKIHKQHNFTSVVVNYVFLSRVFRFFPKGRRVLFTHDVFTAKYQKTGQDWFSLSSRKERCGINRADVVLAIQQNEAVYYKTLTDKPVITTYSYFDFVQTPIVPNLNILYLAGSNSYNVESIVWFIDHIFPSLVNRFEGVKLIIGGRVCNEIGGYMSNKDICLQGEVDDLKLFYSQGNIVVNPTFNGTGLKIKSFEALAYEKVVVSHVHGLEGIFLPESCPILKCSNAEEFSEVLTKLLSDPSKVKQTKKDAQSYMDMFQKEVVKAFESAITLI